MLALRVVFRLVIPHPDQFGEGESGQSGIGGNPDQVVISDLGCDLFAFLGSPLVTPDNGGTDDFIFFVQHHKAVHLAADAHGHNVFLGHAALFQYCTDRADRSIIPVLGILFRPAVLRLVHRIFHRCGADTLTVLVEQNCFRAGCSQVDPKQVFHMHFPLYPQNIVVNH